MQFEQEENDKNRQARIIEAQIRAAGYGSTVDINANQQSDYLDAMEKIQKQDNYRQQMDLDREKEVNRMSAIRETNQLKDKEISSRERIAEKELEIARVNKNKYDKPEPKKKK